MRTTIFLDFDGTITEEDTLVLLLDRFGRPLPDGRDWRVIEYDDSLPENVKLQAEMDLLAVHPETALQWLDGNSRLREGFAEFIHGATAIGFETVILSGGLTPIIERALGNLQPQVTALHANGLKYEDGRWLVMPAASPRINNLCNHCKTWHLHQARAAGHRVVYVGDGSTDFCPAREADLVFARGTLADQLFREGRSFKPFITFDSILPELEGQCTTVLQPARNETM